MITTGSRRTPVGLIGQLRGRPSQRLLLEASHVPSADEEPIDVAFFAEAAADERPRAMAEGRRGMLPAMAAAASIADRIDRPGPAPEQRMLLPSVSWKDYVLLRDLLDGPAIRMTYCEGVLELMSPSHEHELWKTNIARFVELFAHLRRIDLHGYGSATFRKEAVRRGAEPDECYLIGKVLADIPEIVLEVIHTSPLLDKLDVYAGLGVPEVWNFRDGVFTIHGLDRATKRYAIRPASAFIAEIDFAQLARYVVRTDTPQALREFEAEIRGG